MAWWKKHMGVWKLVGRGDPHLGEPAAATSDERTSAASDENDLGLDDLYVAPASESLARSETGLPGTASIPQLLTLIPPPTDPELRRPGP